MRYVDYNMCIDMFFFQFIIKLDELSMNFSNVKNCAYRKHHDSKSNIELKCHVGSEL